MESVFLLRMNILFVAFLTNCNLQNKKKQKQVFKCIEEYMKEPPQKIDYHKKDSICYLNNIVGDNIFVVVNVPNRDSLRFIITQSYISTERKIHKFIPLIRNKRSYTRNKRTKGYTQNKSLIALEYISEIDTTLSYNNIPQKALLWLYILINMYNQRIFILDSNSTRIY